MRYRRERYQSGRWATLTQPQLSHVDYATLSVHPLQFISDQEDMIRLAAISAAAPTAITPERKYH